MYTVKQIGDQCSENPNADQLAHEPGKDENLWYKWLQDLMQKRVIHDTL
jgi:hypothetical protein